MREVPIPALDYPGPILSPRVSEYVIQVSRSPSGPLALRTIKRTPNGRVILTLMVLKDHAVSELDLSLIVTSVTDALRSDLVMGGGMQLSL